jgi:hypothetical protein
MHLAGSIFLTHSLTLQGGFPALFDLHTEPSNTGPKPKNSDIELHVNKEQIEIMSTGVMHVALHSVWPKTIYRLVSCQQRADGNNVTSFSLFRCLSLSRTLSLPCSPHTNVPYESAKATTKAKTTRPSYCPGAPTLGSIHCHEWSPAIVEEELIFSENEEVVAPGWAQSLE